MAICKFRFAPFFSLASRACYIRAGRENQFKGAIYPAKLIRLIEKVVERFGRVKDGFPAFGLKVYSFFWGEIHGFGSRLLFSQAKFRGNLWPLNSEKKRAWGRNQPCKMGSGKGRPGDGGSILGFPSPFYRESWEYPDSLEPHSIHFRGLTAT